MELFLMKINKTPVGCTMKILVI